MPAGVRGLWSSGLAECRRALIFPTPRTPYVIPLQRLQTHRAFLNERSLLESWRSMGWSYEHLDGRSGVLVKIWCSGFRPIMPESCVASSFSSRALGAGR